jgi:SAM-dependent methyltransferase
MHNSTTRFSNRVEDYVKYRPSYPSAIIDFLKNNYGLTPDNVIADIGAGTGISSALFLNAGYRIQAIEPNKEMREKAVELLGAYPGFTIQDGTAENTGLDAGSVDIIIAGQAFHWFDAVKAKAEFERILRHGCITILIWNDRKITSDFEQDYEQLINRHASDYKVINHRNIDAEKIASFFNPAPIHFEIFANNQVFDFEGLKGRLLSSSYMPAYDEEGYGPMISDLKILFDRYQQAGLITINYDTKVYVGRL